LLERSQWWRNPLFVGIAGKVGQLATLLIGISTLLFFLLRFAGDPAYIMAGDNASASFIHGIRELYGLDKPLIFQYFIFIWRIIHFDFGISLASSVPALNLVLHQLPWTLKLAGLAIITNIIIAFPLGSWIGRRPEGKMQSLASSIIFIFQGTPGFVVGLILIQIFAVKFGLLPSIGSEGGASWVLPTATLAAFLIPRLTRIVATNVTEAMRADYVRTARAAGASEVTVLMRHALPNAALGATALAGSQLSYLLSGALITESIFAWPGLGLLLIDSVRTLDFPVVQAAVFIIATLVFATNTLIEILFKILDPRLKKASR
jgi:peptide/nickel transport system permease protein